MMNSTQVTKAKANPTRVYNSPTEVVHDSITDEAKLRILRSWEDEAHQLQAAADESMGGGESSRLDEIRAAIDAIENRAAH